MMKNFLLYISIFLLIGTTSISAQEVRKGVISFVSLKNVYVQFEATKGISIGDTLYLTAGKKEPALVVKFISSTSVATERLVDKKLLAGASIYAFPEEEIKQDDRANTVIKDDIKIVKRKTRGKKKSEISHISGKFGVTSFTNLSNTNTTPDYQRWRYVLAFDADRIFNTGFSFNSYITFNYRADEWSYIKNNYLQRLRIYNLAINYEPTSAINVSLGRKVNPNISNIGVFDGINVEYRIGSFSIGGIAGSRPNPIDFGYNLNYSQYGFYLTKMDTLGYGLMKNSIAFMQQLNHSKIDRRFLYLQHNSAPIKNLNLFLSSEIDLYKNINGVAESIFRMTGVYAMFRYRFSSNLSASLTYDERKRVIYYETYKTTAERLFDDAVRRGVKLRVILRPYRFVTLNLYAGFRNREGDPKSSINLGGSISHSKLPVYQLSGSLAGNFINTAYLTGGRVTARIYRNFFDGLLNSSISLKSIVYAYGAGELVINQNIIGLSTSINISRKLSIFMDIENIFEGRNTFSRIYLGLNQRL